MGQNSIRGMSFMQTVLYWFVSLMGGYAHVYDLHRLLTWFFIVFFIGHVYMILAHDVGDKKGTVSSMISGYEAEKE
jgi:Ni/Fe-hydrogenase 1 B-type cytochrome subunit